MQTGCEDEINTEGWLERRGRGTGWECEWVSKGCEGEDGGRRTV